MRHIYNISLLLFNKAIWDVSIILIFEMGLNLRDVIPILIVCYIACFSAIYLLY